MATRKISDLTLLEAGSVSSSDTLLLLDNSDPTDQNKRTAVGSIFRAVPSGTYTTPGVQFELKTSTGLFSEAQGQVGLAMGDARLNLLLRNDKGLYKAIQIALYSPVQPLKELYVALYSALKGLV